MNRERKYRVWDISHKTFLPTDVYALIKSDFGAFGIMLKDWDNYKECEYLYHNSQIQSDFTGLLDKNGKEIYEGDVLQGDNSVIYSVIFCDGSFDLVVEKFYLGDNSKSAKERFPYPQPMCYFVFTSIVVIGNVYENKNLIN